MVYTLSIYEYSNIEYFDRRPAKIDQSEASTIICSDRSMASSTLNTDLNIHIIIEHPIICFNYAMWILNLNIRGGTLSIMSNHFINVK